MSFNKKAIYQLLLFCLILVPLLYGCFITPRNVQNDYRVVSTSQESAPTFFETLTSKPHSLPQGLNFPATPTSEISAPNGPLNHATFGNLLVLYGDYVNESSQEPIGVWISLFRNLGFNTTASHIAAFNQSSEFDLLIVTPSVGTSNTSFGVPIANAEAIGACSQPILLLGYGHEVLDRLFGFNPLTDFIPSVERYLWSTDETQQIFSLPHKIPHTSGRLGIYSDHVNYDAYRMTVLPPKVEVLGTNFDGSGAQLFWFRSFSPNPHIYYWGINQVRSLNSQGWLFCENLIHWLIRPSLQHRLGETLAAWQLPAVSDKDYWAIQGSGGFGYPLEPSIRFSYFVTEMVYTNRLPLNLSIFRSWLFDRYNPDMGYFEDLSSSQIHDRCITTAMSVLMANYLDVLEHFNQSRISDYLADCQDITSGGFFTERNSVTTSIAATRFAIEALAILNQLHLINKTAAIDYIVNCQELNPLDSEFGGFYFSTSGGLMANLVYSTDALIALKQLDALDYINQSALLYFIASCEEPHDSAIFDTKFTLDSDEWILGTSCVIQILTILNSHGVYDINTSRTYILANQYPNGGWGRGDTLHDFHNSPDETWQVTKALTLTGGLGTAEQNLIKYITQCFTDWGGATEPILFGDFLTSVEIISTLSQIDALKRINLTAFLKYLENCWSQSRSSFVSHQLPSVVGTDTDSPTPDRILLEAGTFGPLYHYAYSQLISILGLSGTPWTTYATQIRHEIEACQSEVLEYSGMLGLHHLYVGHESDFTFRFDTTCWNLIAHQILGGQPVDLKNASSVVSYLIRCLQTNSTHQYFYDITQTVSIPAPWRDAKDYLAETWMGLQAYAYLNPLLSNLDGQKLATYALSFLQKNPSLITTYYATEILHFLVESGLKPDAFNLHNWTSIKTDLINAFSFDGLVNDLSLPPRKWMPHLVNLALQLIHRLQLVTHLDVSPILNLTEITYPTGTLPLGQNITFSAYVTEIRWGYLPPTLQVQTQIFNTSFIDSCSLVVLGYFEHQDVIPYAPRGLGPQNLSLTAYSPGAIPNYIHIPTIFTGWGTIALQTVLSPSTRVPRSIPLNVTMQLGFDGATNFSTPLINGNVTITVETTSDTYQASLQRSNQYFAFISTHNLTPTNHILRINATVPFCSFYTETLLISVVVFDTHLYSKQIYPSAPVLFDPTSLVIELRNGTGISLGGYQIIFNITRPTEALPFHSVSSITDENGLASCTWIPNEIGEWTIVYTFSGQDMFGACQNVTLVQVKGRPLACFVTLLPSSVLYLGNQSFIQVEVSDSLNGSFLANLQIDLYENSMLLDTATTDVNGKAICQWLTSAPVGFRELHIEIMGTATYESWISSPLIYLVRDTTTLSATSNTTQLYLGETIDIDVKIVALNSANPNGTASVFWDGIWRDNILITQGFGSIKIPILYSESTGDHLIVILFGHLDTPDSYSESSTALHIYVRKIITPSITIAVDPPEIADPLLQPTLLITVHLSYINGTYSYGLSANLSIQIHSQDDVLLVTLEIETDVTGSSLIIINTPQPGLYSVAARFNGERGFAPSLATTILLVHYPQNVVGGLFNPLLLGSVAVMIIGLLVGVIVFMRLQKQLNEFLKGIKPNQSVFTNSSINRLQSIDQSLSEQRPNDSPNLNDD